MASTLDAAIDSVLAERKPAPPLKVFVGNIYGRNVEPQHWQCVDALRSARMQQMLDIRVRFQPHWNDALICRARSTTATSFLLDTDFDVHVLIGGDIVFEPWQVAQIARQAVDYDIVTGLYMTRSREDSRPTSIFEPGTTITFADDPTPVPIKWAASGFTATHRRVFERLALDLPLCHDDKPWRFFPFYQPMILDGLNGGKIYASEDYAFSERARAVGFTSHVAPNIRIFHLGLHGHRLEDALQKPLSDREITITYQADGRFKFEAASDGDA